MTPQEAKRGGQAGRPKGAYRRGGGYRAMWVEVLILALKDWVRTERPCFVTSRAGKVYRYKRADNGRRLPGMWFESAWCREIVIMAGTEGMKMLRFYFVSRSHLSEEKRAKILGKIDRLNLYLK